MAIIKIVEKYPVLTIFLLAFVAMLPSLNGLQVTIMEARNFITAREMVSDGNWILTTMNGIPRYAKPPLPTWITAMYGWAFGLNNIFALRLPSVIMVGLVGAYTYLLSTKFVEKRQSVINGLIAVTSFYVLAITIEAPWDIYTHAFMLIGILYLVKGYSSNHFRDSAIAVIFIAFSVLSKGPISLYALLLPFLFAYPIVYGFKNKFLFKTAIALLCGALLGGIWFVYVRLVDPEAFIKIAKTEAENWSSYHTRPFYYYWSFFTQSGLWTIPALIGLFYPYLITRVNNKKAYKLSFLWTLFAVVLLSVIPEKKSRYLMPVLIPLAINTGFYIQYLVQKFDSIKRKVETFPVYFNFGALGILGLLFPVIGYFLFRDKLNAVLPNYILASILLFTIGAFIIRNLARKNVLQVIYLSVMLFAAILFSIGPILAKMQIQNKIFAPITNLKSEADKQNIDIYLFDELSPEMLWDYGSIIPQLEYTNGDYKFPSKNKFGLLVNNKDSLFQSQAIDRFSINEIATYNRNIAKEGARRHDSRNINYYFVLTKKDEN